MCRDRRPIVPYTISVCEALGKETDRIRRRGEYRSLLLVSVVWFMSFVPRTVIRVLLLFSLLTVAGCLPYSCQQETDRALFPSDSVSRQIAQNTPTDTVQVLDTIRGGSNRALKYPRTVRFLEDGRLAASDVERNSVFLFDRDGTLQREIADEAFAVPYLIGHRGDTLVVFNAETDRVDLVTEEGRHSEQSRSISRPEPETLVYMLATETSLYAKVVGRETGASIMRLGATGQPIAQADFEGPYWRHAGFLRAWGNRVISLSGFRPVVHHVPKSFSDGATPDSLSLVGFDSPMLERSHAFATGDVSNPPLLAASAVPVGDTLFVLNLRPGWVHLDAYDRAGRLQRRLVERHDAGNRDFYPVDLDARRTEAGYQFAVAIRSPEPQVKLLRWQPEAP